MIPSLDVNKAHGYGDTSIRTIKIYDNLLVRPLSILFKKSFDNSSFPELWQKSNIIPAHKKNYKQKFKTIAPLHDSLF